MTKIADIYFQDSTVLNDMSLIPIPDIQER